MDGGGGCVFFVKFKDRSEPNNKPQTVPTFEVHLITCSAENNKKKLRMMKNTY